MAADYKQPDNAEKRVRFFDGQYLQDQDFIDEQKYHIDRQRRHHRTLHIAGIADGLEVKPAAAQDKAGATQVNVTAGTAIDENGRQLVLAQDQTIDLPLSVFKSKTAAIYIVYEETAADPQTAGGIESDSRWLERPVIFVAVKGEALQRDYPPILLAELSLDGNGAITDNPLVVREYSGLRLPGPNAPSPTLRSHANGRVTLEGNLAVTGNVGIGTASPGADLDVSGKADTAGQASLQLRSGNSASNYSSNQITLGYNNTGEYLHAIKTRHNGAGTSGNAIDFYVWKYLGASDKDDKDTIGTLHTMTLEGGNVGIGTTSPDAALHVAGTDGVLFGGTLNSGTIPALGGGVRMMWYPKKAAFRAGSVSGDQWSDANIGSYSTALGLSTTASGSRSTAIGDSTTASGDYSTALGLSTTASGFASSAMGDKTIASGNYSTALGLSTTASGFASSAMGRDTTASGNYSFAIGREATASGDYSTALGLSTTASGFASSAMGDKTIASGNYSTALGLSTTAGGFASSAMGRDTTASSNYSTALGYSTTASGQYSTAMSKETTASGFAATAMGLETTASGDYSLAAGRRAKAKHFGAFVWADGQDSNFESTASYQFLIRATGGVGIGTTNPVGRLDVRGSDHQLTLTNSDKNDSWGLTNWNNTLWFQYRSSAKASTSAPMVIQKNGNVGIGTTSPDNKLEVNGAIEIQVNDADSKLRFHDPDDAWYSMGIDRSDGGKFKLNYGADIGEYDQFVMTGGKVGIGTANPVGRLDVSASDHQLTLTNSDKNDSWGLTNWNNTLYFQYRSSANATNYNRMMIDKAGNMNLRYGVSINEFSNDGNLSGNSDKAVPTEKAVKAYVEKRIAYVWNRYTKHYHKVGVTNSTYPRL